MLVLVLGVALAAERWEDGLVQRIPQPGVAARLEGASAPAQGLWFGDLQLGVGRRWGGMGAGITAQVGAQTGRSSTGPYRSVGPLGADLWMVLEDGPGLHGFAVGVHGPPERQWFYFAHPAETGTRLSFRYVATTTTDADVQISGELRGGWSQVMPFELAVAGSLTKIVRPWLALSGAALVGYMPSGLAMGGLHLRPLQGLEVGLQGGVSVPLEQRRVPSVQAMAAIKGWWVGAKDRAR